MFFIVIERLWKILRKFCAETVQLLLKKKKCAETENLQLIFLYIEDCMTASEDISMFFDERAAAS